MFRRFSLGVGRRAVVVIGLSLVVVHGTTALAQDHRNATSAHGMVVSISVEASDVGAKILEQGGNAVDAAIATAFALAVTHPSAGNIGGGGFMLVHPGDGSAPTFIDYREKAPLSSTKTMFLDEQGDYVDGGSRKNHLYVGVPGTVAGMVLAHEQFGSLAWTELVTPAVTLAEDGFVLNHLAAQLNRVLERSNNDEFKRVYGKSGGDKPWLPTDRLVLGDLGRTLRRINELGLDGFYSGETADLLHEEMQRGGGYITREDLTAYEAVIREPIHGMFRGYDIYSAPPPSSGGISLTLMLNMLENFDLKASGRWSSETVHIIVETMRRAYANRAKYLGDSDFIDIPTHLTDKLYAKGLAEGIDVTRATRSEQFGPPITLVAESPETTHFSVIDSTGMAVSNTYTLENGYGAGVVVTGAGFLLNNEMGDFNKKPGLTSPRGEIGTLANQIAPEKRMLSSMTPTIVSRDGKVYLVTGSPGGRTIINTVLNVTLNVLEFEMNMREAVDAPRLNMQWMPDRLGFQAAEDPQYADLVDALRAMGHTVARGGGGDANSILVEDGTFIGAADNQNGGASGASGSQ